jgi:parallel beta-helix repeat protein
MRVRRRVVRSIGAVLAVVAGVTVLPSTALARPIACGSVVTRSVVLTHDLLGCQGDGLVVGASGITIDLGGHAVAGLLSDDSVGIRNAGRAHVLVKNGVVRGFERGIQLTGATGNRLRGLTVELNGSDGIDLNHASDNQILGGEIRDNFTGVLLRDGSAGNLVANTVLQGNHGAGIRLELATGNRLTGNIVNGNGSAVEPLTGQILLVSSRRNRLDTNDVSASSTIGVVLIGSDGNQLRGNQVGFVGSDGNVGGISLLSDSDRSLLQDNTVADNRPGDGIFVEVGSDRTSLRNNLASGNGDDGIEVDDPDTRIVGNRADDNDDLGVEAVAGVTDGGGNTAKGNGNPVQCLNLRCT